MVGAQTLPRVGPTMTTGMLKPNLWSQTSPVVPKPGPPDTKTTCPPRPPFRCSSCQALSVLSVSAPLWLCNLPMLRARACQGWAQISPNLRSACFP